MLRKLWVVRATVWLCERARARSPARLVIRTEHIRADTMRCVVFFFDQRFFFFSVWLALSARPSTIAVVWWMNEANADAKCGRKTWHYEEIQCVVLVVRGNCGELMRPITPIAIQCSERRSNLHIATRCTLILCWYWFPHVWTRVDSTCSTCECRTSASNANARQDWNVWWMKIYIVRLKTTREMNWTIFLSLVLPHCCLSVLTVHLLS